MAKAIEFIIFFVVGIIVGALSLSAINGPVRTVQLQTMEDPIIQMSSPIVAVDSSEQHGIMGNVTVKLIPGTGNILVDTDPFTEPDLQYSAQLAAQVAQQKAGVVEDKDFVFTYDMAGENVDVVGGGSAGAATTIAAIAAIQNRSLHPGVAMTGTITQNGSIGKVGAVLEKAKAAADAGYTTFLVPKGEATFTSYQPTRSRRGFIRYAPQSVDLVQTAKGWGLTIKEVSTIDDAMDEMIA